MIAAAVSSEVCAARITSTSFSTGTGLKKCIPITRSGRSVAAASEVIGIEEVFEARTALGRAAPSARRKSSSFTAASSTTASSSRSAATRSSTAVDAREHLVRVGAALLGQLLEALRIAASPRSVAPGAASYSETRRPDAATTWAMPPPIWPRPTTRTCSNSIARRLTGAGARRTRKNAPARRTTRSDDDSRPS